MNDPVSIATETGPREVEGAKVGDFFAVHRTSFSFGPSEDYWSITHTPSGRALGLYWGSANQAKRAAQKLARLPIDWDAVTSSNFRELIGEHMNEVIDIVRRGVGRPA